MRVVLVGPYPVDPQQARGGVVASFSALIDGLTAASDIDLHIVTFVPGLEARARRTVGGVPIDYLPGTSRAGNLTLHVRERRALERELEELRPDLVHAQDAVRYGYVCLKAARNVPVVVSVHGIVREEVRYLGGLTTRAKARFAQASLERYCIRHALYLVQPTRYPEVYFDGEIRGRIVDVGNPIADRFFSDARTPQPGRVLYAGGIMPRKRVLDVVEAMPHVLSVSPDASLRIAGAEIDPEYGARVRARVKELDLESRVTLLGGLSPERMLAEYRDAHVLVLPSAQETSPMVIGEAMAAALPVVATRVGGVEYLVEEGVTGHVVEVGDIETLARRISGILDDSRVSEAMSTAAREKAGRLFRPSAVAARVREVYTEALRSAQTTA